MTNDRPKSAIVIIGNEILSGRTQDKNVNYIAKTLTEIGIDLWEVRVVPDDKEFIISTILEMSDKYKYVFTTGGIGSTHDDLTSACIAEAFGKKLEYNKTAIQLLEAFYEDRDTEFNDARKRMALIPNGARLIDNPVTAAPGFQVENVYALAGVPSIMRAMFDSLKNELKGGKKVISRTYESFVPEGDIADKLADIQKRNKKTDIGSYPQIKDGRLGVSIVVRAEENSDIDSVEIEIKALLRL